MAGGSVGDLDCVGESVGFIVAMGIVSVKNGSREDIIDGDGVGGSKNQLWRSKIIMRRISASTNTAGCAEPAFAV